MKEERRRKPRKYKFGISFPTWIALASMAGAGMMVLLVQATEYGGLKKTVETNTTNVAKFEQDYKQAIRDSEGRLMMHISGTQNQMNKRMQGLEAGIQTILKEMPRK